MIEFLLLNRLSTSNEKINIYEYLACAILLEFPPAHFPPEPKSMFSKLPEALKLDPALFISLPHCLLDRGVLKY